MLRKIELIFWLNILGAIGFYLFQWPMVGPMVIVSTSILSMFYMYLSFAVLNGIRGREIAKKTSYQDVSTVRLIGTIALGLCFSLILISVLFKLMMWPNVFPIILAGISGVLIGLILAAWKLVSNSATVYRGIIVRSVIFLGIGLTVLLVPKYAVLEHQYADYPDYIEAFKAKDNNPNSPKLNEDLEAERLKVLEEESLK